MDPAQRQFLKDFFQSVTDRPIEPDSKEYVALHEQQAGDPVKMLLRGIDFSIGSSTQLFSGFRGAGKSTELRRLRRDLKKLGYTVLLFDIESYLDMSTPIDITDFLITLAGAVGDELAKPELLGWDLTEKSYFERFFSFLNDTKVEIPELSAELGGVGLKASLKQDPDFRSRVQQHLTGHLSRLVEDVRLFLGGAVDAMREQHGSDHQVVLLVDSLEHIRGTYGNEEEVQRSVETLFATHSDKLQFDCLHVVYTVPPYLKVRYPAIGSLYRPGKLQMLPSVKVFSREEKTHHEPGLELLREVARRRGEIDSLLGEDDLTRICQLSGGHLRDLMRLLAEVIRLADSLPVRTEVVKEAIQLVRNEYLPIANEDARWLAGVARTHTANLEAIAALPHLTRFFDTYMVLLYRNGTEWYDVHPLLREHVIEQASAVEDRPAGG